MNFTKKIISLIKTKNQNNNYSTLIKTNNLYTEAFYQKSMQLKTTANYYRKLKEPNKINFKYRRFNNIEEIVKERNEFVEKIKQSRKEITKKYWEEYAEVEKTYLTSFNIKQAEKNREKQAKDVKFSITQAFQCLNLIKERSETHGRFYAKQKVWQLEEFHRKEEIHNMLYLLDKQTSEWLIPKNNDNAFLHDLVEDLVPHTIMTHKDYYSRVNEYALLLDEGKIEEAAKFKATDANYKMKNMMLVPIFQNLKKMIKHLSTGPEYKYLESYRDIRLKLENNMDIEHGEGKLIMQEINKKYSNLLNLLREYLNYPGEKLKYIERTLFSITNLIITWNHYIEVLYLRDEEINQRKQKNIIDTRELDKYDYNELYYNEDEESVINFKEFPKTDKLVDLLQKPKFSDPKLSKEEKIKQKIKELKEEQKSAKHYLSNIKELNSK